MGLNVVVGCFICRESAWVFRGEGVEVEVFYKRHWRCVREHGDVIGLSDDQTSAWWVHDPEWTQHTVPDPYPREDAA